MGKVNAKASPTKIAKALSTGEESFAQHCMCYQLAPEREYLFAKPRKWRFDFAFKDEMIAVEIEGGVWSNGRHSRGKGFEDDARKYNAAAILGWRVLRFSTQMVISGEAIDITMACLQGRYIGAQK